MPNIRAIDLFCGAGGSSWGARQAGAEIVAGFDMWELAGKTYKDNFPKARFYPGRLEDLDVQAVARDLGQIDLLLASPECTNHSPARGNRPRCEASKATAFQVIRFARVFQPRWIVIENVVSMRNWKRYEEFLDKLRNSPDLKYNVSVHTLVASDYGVPQARRRLFILCDREQEPSAPRRKPGTKKTAASVVDGNGSFPFTPLRTPRRAKATIERAKRAIAELGTRAPFLLVYYGSDHAGGWQRLDVPLRTLTTLDRFAYVRPNHAGHEMRMLQVPELKRAMGMQQRFRFMRGNRRERIHMIGNAVCPPVMKTIVKGLKTNG